MKKYLALIIFFIGIPLLLPYIFKKIYLFLIYFKDIGSIDGWLGFLGGYTGGIIAIGGIWWQLNREEKNKKKGLIEYLLYTINKNTENKDSNKISYDIQNLISYTSFSNEKNYKPLYEFEENFFNDNIKIIMELNKDKKNLGSKLLDMRETINNFNHSVQFLSTNSYYKCKLLDELNKFLEKNLKKQISEIKIIIALSNIISKYNCYFDKLNEETIPNFKGSKLHNRYICLAKTQIDTHLKNCIFLDSHIKSNLQNLLTKSFMKEERKILSKDLNDLLITIINNFNENIYEHIILNNEQLIDDYVIFFKKIKEFNTIENSINGNFFQIITTMKNIEQDLARYSKKI